MSRNQALTPRQRLFVESYAGNGTQAAIAAGCSEKTAPVTASKWLKLPKVIEALRRRDEKRSKATIASREEILEMWSEVARDSSARTETRLKAGELLEKARGGFTQKLEVRGELQLIDLLREAAGEPKPAEPPKEVSQEAPVEEPSE